MPVLPKPSECQSCILYEKDKYGFSIPEGKGTIPLGIFGEGLGEAERRDGLPFRPYAQAGSLLEQAFRRVGHPRTEFALYNVVNCFASPRASVFTSKGYKGIAKIRAGDKVLTHKGRFKTVQALIHNTGRVNVVHIRVQTQYTGVDTVPVKSVVTQDHRFLRNGEWTEAASLLRRDSIAVLGSKCVECGSIFHRHHNKHSYIPFCSLVCHNRYTGRKGSEKSREIMLEAYRSGRRDPATITKAANAAFRELVKGGWRPRRGATDETYLKTALTRQALGIGKFTWIGFGEKKLVILLESSGRDFTSQFAIGPYNYDFLVGNVLLEIDGPGFNNAKVRERSRVKDSIAKAKGYQVHHISHEHVEEALNLLDNDEHNFVYTEAKILSIESKTWLRGSWTLVVEDDESYVGQGLVSHNCQPPRNFLAGAPWETEAIQQCRVHRDNFMEKYKPRALFALGGIACRTLTGLSGKKQGITLVRGYVLPSDLYSDDNGTPIPVISTFHPAFIRRGQSKYQGVLYHDLLKAIDIAQNGWEPEPTGARYYSTDPSQEEAEALAVRIENNPSLKVCYDVETPYSADKMEDEMESEDVEHRLESIQFSVEAKTGYYFPWVQPFIGIAKRILCTPNEKLSFNGYLFDDPILLSAGCEINGVRHDLMCAWHHLQPDIDANLQFAASFYDFPFPWKHLSADEPRFYGCCDVDAPQRMAAKIFSDMDKRGVRRGYEQHIVKLRRTLYKAECRGIPVNDEKRVTFGKEIKGEEDKAFARLQALIPPELNKTHPPQGYKREPMGVRGAVGRYLLWRNAVTIEPKQVPELIKYVQERSTIPEIPSSAGKDRVNRTGEWDLRRFPVMEDPELESYGDPGEWRWCIVKPFLPSSHVQLKDYMRFKGHPIPKDFKTRKETTEAPELEKMAKKFSDPVYGGVIDIRRLHKMLATYVEGWVPKKDGRVHTSFTFRPATGQLSSRSPNAQNVPAHSKLGKRFREIIEAPSGYTLVAADFRAFHALTTGYEAGDKAYMRMARLDIHSFLASHLVGKPVDPSLPDEEIVPLLQAIKKEYDFIRNKQAKPCILGYGFGLQVRHFYEINKEVIINDKPVMVFKNVGEARKVTKMLDGLFAIACRWREEIPKLAHRQTYLVTSHGYVRYFHEVFRWDKRRQMLVPGDDREKAIAFKPANDAFGHIKDVMLRLEVRGLNDRYGFINQIHDELMFCCLNELVDECVREVHKEMEKPSTILVDPLLAPGGLWCGAEVSVGKNWNEMVEVQGASISIS